MTGKEGENVRNKKQIKYYCAKCGKEFKYNDLSFVGDVSKAARNIKYLRENLYCNKCTTFIDVSFTTSNLVVVKRRKCGIISNFTKGRGKKK